MRLTPSKTLVRIFFTLPLLLLLLFGYTMGWPGIILSVLLCWIAKKQRWLRQVSYQVLRLHSSGYGEWTIHDHQLAFHVRKHTILLPFLIILQYQTLLSGKIAFAWIVRDSCDSNDFRDLTLKLKRILSKYEPTEDLKL